MHKMHQQVKKKKNFILKQKNINYNNNNVCTYLQCPSLA